MKVTTTPKDYCKGNQIVPIMQEHLGSVMNLARIKLQAFVLHAMCVVQTVSLHKIAAAMPTAVKRDSNLRRQQRFLASYALNLDLIAKVFLRCFRSRKGWCFLWTVPTGNSMRQTSTSSCSASLIRELPILCCFRCLTNEAIPTRWYGQGLLTDSYVCSEPTASTPLWQTESS